MDITVEAIKALRVPDAFTPVVGYKRFGVLWPPARHNITWCKRVTAGSLSRSPPQQSAGGRNEITSQRTHHARRNTRADQPFRGIRGRSGGRARLEAEGIKDLVTLQFYAGPESTEVGAILTFADRNRIMERINIITAWEKFERFFGTVKPVDVRVYGKLSVKAEEWMRKFEVVSKTLEDHVAGFVR